MNNRFKFHITIHDTIDALKHKSLYLIGAGASCNYIPNKPDLLKHAKKYLELKYVLPSQDIPKNSYTISDYAKSTHSRSEEYAEIENILSNPMILKISALDLCSTQSPLAHCPEYDILSLSNSASLFLNFNHDNLLSTCLSKRSNRIINMHGSITQNYSFSKYSNRLKISGITCLRYL